VVNVEVLRLGTLFLVILAAVVFAAQMRRGNIAIVRSRSSEYARMCAELRREQRREARRVAAIERGQSTLVAWWTRVTGGGGAA
jgi:hypothetical protein